MQTFLRSLMVMALVVWVGGMIFFAFVVAPSVFNPSVLPTRELAGRVVTRALTILCWMGLICGIVYLASSMAYARHVAGAVHPLAVRNLLVYAMLVLTLVSLFVVMPKMAALRAEMVDIDAVPVTDARRVEFNRLHGWSTRLGGGVLLLGIAVIVLTSRHL